MGLPVCSESSVTLVQVSKNRGCSSTALVALSKPSTVLALHGSFTKKNCSKGEKLQGFSALDILPPLPKEKPYQNSGKSVHVFKVFIITDVLLYQVVLEAAESKGSLNDFLVNP